MKQEIKHLESELKIAEKEVKNLQVKVKQLLKINDNTRYDRIRDHAIKLLADKVKDDLMREKLFVTAAPKARCFDLN